MTWELGSKQVSVGADRGASSRGVGSQHPSTRGRENAGSHRGTCIATQTRSRRFDVVPRFPSRVQPIAPNDSFVAEFTPPRSGTFPYHSHLNERHQINSGMYGAIIVTDKPRDLTRDHLIVAGGGGPELMSKIESPFALVNGRRFPARRCGSPPAKLIGYA